MNIYTRSGDSGQTSLPGGRRVPKNDPRLEICGTIDELNSFLGLVRSESLPSAIDAVLRRVQSELFLLGADVIGPTNPAEKPPAIAESHVQTLETDIDRLNASLPSLKTFLLPGGARAAASLHVARTVARRAERHLVSFAESQPASVHSIWLAYLNRLSDLLFILARSVNAQAQIKEPLWEK